MHMGKELSQWRLGSLELEFQVVVSSLTGELEANLGLLCKNSIKILFTEVCLSSVLISSSPASSKNINSAQSSILLQKKSCLKPFVYSLSASVFLITLSLINYLKNKYYVFIA